ncbi:MAG: PD-(D/E)XK nuclease family protein, partial [Selenomonadaceae bacterium]|nr:PD-(D/E)XK nuclease family protein [Selenomonadaceae bacterium]
AAGEKLFVQGIIDLLFKDSVSGDWILLDYKTDRDNSDEYFQREYHDQLRLYAQAIESLTSIKIAEKYLYLLNAGRLIAI